MVRAPPERPEEFGFSYQAHAGEPSCEGKGGGIGGNSASLGGNYHIFGQIQVTYLDEVPETSIFFSDLTGTLHPCAAHQVGSKKSSSQRILGFAQRELVNSITMTHAQNHHKWV
jgi:hypothetical protein